MLNFKGMRFPIDVILVCIRGYASYPLSYRHLEEMMEEHGVSVDYSSINRSAAAKRFFDKAMGASIRRWVLTDGDPDKVAMDKSGANKAAINEVNAGRDVPIVVRQVQYLNNIVEQDHRAIKRVTRPMLNFKSFRSASSVLAGIDLMHMIRKGQFEIDGVEAMSFADQFSAMAGALLHGRLFGALLNNSADRHRRVQSSIISVQVGPCRTNTAKTVATNSRNSTTR